MTRKEYAEIGKMKDAELAAYSVYETAAIEAHVAQANDADARCEALREKHSKESAVTADKHASDLEAALSDSAARVADLEAKLAQAEAMIKALGGTELGLQLAKERRQAELTAAKAKIDEELAKIS